MSGALPEAVNYHRYLYERLRPDLGTKVWEIGAGHGQYTAMLLDDARRVLATDIDEEMVARLGARRQAAGGSLDVERVDLLDETTIAACAAWKPDSILCLNVLEHIDEDTRALEWIRRHVSAPCTAVFLTPAHPSLYGFMDSEAGHFRRYTRATLAAAFERAGWSVRRSFYLNPIGGLGWYVRSHLLPPPSRDLDDPRVNDDIRFFDRYLVGPTRALDAVFGRMFGQSVVVVATNGSTDVRTLGDR